MNKKSVFILLLTFASLVGVISSAYIVKNPKYYHRIKSKVIRFIKPARTTTNDSNPLVLPKSSYSKHVKSGKKYGSLYETNSEIRSQTNQGKLVKVKKNTGYKVQKLNHSLDVLVPESLQVLQEIGKKFHTNTNGKYFTITSLTRSVESQKRLTKTNSNATKNISSHSYGVSFDISYIRFNGVKGHNSNLKKSLEKILVDLSKEKKIYFIHEKSQSCYHVTVR